LSHLGIAEQHGFKVFRITAAAAKSRRDACDTPFSDELRNEMS
jgi:hypothetical protein